MPTLIVPIGAGDDDGFLNGGFFPSEVQVAFGSAGGSAVNAWAYFPSVALPDGQVILDAYLRGTATTNLIGSVAVRVYAEDADDPAAPTSARDYNSRTLTTVSRAWTPDAFAAGEEYRTPNLAPVIQEVIERPGWASGNAIGILIQDDGSSNVRAFAAFGHATFDPVELVIEYTEQADPNVYYTDFTHNAADEAPSDWQPEWGASSSGMVVLDSGLPTGTTAGKALRLTRTVGTDAYAWTPPGTPSGDVQVWARVRRDATGAVDPVVLHGGGTVSTKDGYRLRATFGDPGQSIIAKYTGNVNDNLEVGGPGMEPDVWYEVLIERVGLVIRSKLWVSGMSEPGTWDLSVEDSDHSSGWVGASVPGAAVNLWIDQIGVGVGGSAAPRETPPNPGETIFLDSIASSEAMGQPTIDPGTLSVPVNGIPSSEAIGQLAVNVPFSVAFEGIASSEAMGQFIIDASIRVQLSGIASTEALGQLTILAPLTVSFGGIASSAAMGILTVTGEFDPPVIPPDPPPPPAQYTVWLRDFASGAIIAHLGAFERLSWTHDIHSLSEWELEVWADEDIIAWATGDSVIDVWRDGESEFTGLVDEVDYDDETGLATVRGVDARGILAWRTIYPVDGADHVEEAAASQSIRNYVLANLGAGADTSRDLNSALSGLTFTVENVSLGATVLRSERYSNLLDVALDIAAAASIFFRVELTASGYQLVFDEHADKSGSVRLTVPLLTASKMGVTHTLREYVNAVRIVGEDAAGNEAVYDAVDDDNPASALRREAVIGSDHPTTARLQFSDADQWGTDFSEYPDDASPDAEGPPGWTRRWDAGSIYAQIDSDAGSIGGQLQFGERRTPPGEGRFAISPDLAGIQNSPVEILVLGEFGVAQESVLIVALAGAGAADTNESGYTIEFHAEQDSGGNEWQLRKLVNGVAVDLVDGSTPNIVANTLYAIRLRREGKLIRYKVWESGTAEPDWSEFEDPDLDTGWLGVGRYQKEGISETRIDWFSFGLRGAPAPDTYAPQTITIGDRTYTVSHDLSQPDTLRLSLSGAALAQSLAAAINGDAGEGELYGEGTEPHADVAAVLDGSSVIVYATNAAARVELDAELVNGSWSEAAIGPLASQAEGLLQDRAARVRSYTVELNPETAPYRDAVEAGDLVTAMSRWLDVSEIRIVSQVTVELDAQQGERVTVVLGIPPLTVLDTIQRHGRDLRRLRTR